MPLLLMLARGSLWARRERIVLAMFGGVVYTAPGEAVAIEEMLRRFPIE